MFPSLARSLLVALCLASLALSSGCAVMGRQQQNQPIDPVAVASVKPGMSRAQVTDLLGAPREILFIRKDNDPVRELAYVFEYTTTLYTGVVFAFLNFGNSDQKQDRVVVFLDEEGNVAHVGASLEGDRAAYGFPFGK